MPQRPGELHRNFMRGSEFGFEPRGERAASDLRQCNFRGSRTRLSSAIDVFAGVNGAKLLRARDREGQHFISAVDPSVCGGRQLETRGLAFHREARGWNGCSSPTA